MYRAASVFALLMCLLLVIATSANAQVATTDLGPAALKFPHPQAIGLNSTTLTPDNPAALAWGTPSRVAAGKAQGDVTDNNAGQTVLEFDGAFGGFRAVGETFGVAADTYSVKDDVGANLTLDKGSSLQVSVAPTEWLSFGIGAGTEETDSTLIDPSSTRQEVDRLMGGATLRLGEIFYIGAGMTQEDATSPDDPLGQVFTRDGTMFGVAVRTEGEWNWYLAADVIDLDDFPPVNPGQQGDGGIKLTTLTAQLRADWFFVGIQGGNIDISGNMNTTTDVTTKVVDLGYAPLEGFNISARWQSTDVEDTDPVNPVDATVETTSLALAWMF